MLNNKDNFIKFLKNLFNVKIYTYNNGGGGVTRLKIIKRNVEQ